MTREALLKLILAISLIGLGVAGYQTYEHYYIDGGAVCDVSETFSCSAVSGSTFGEFPPDSGIATALWGVFWWVGLIYLAYSLLKDHRIIGDQEFYLFGYIASGMAFVIYLLVIELYILPQQTGNLAICLFCTVQHVFILILLGLSYPLLKKPVAQSIKDGLYRNGSLKPKPFFAAGTLLLIAVGGYFILGANTVEHNYNDFASCLAEENATMYGFDACPHCNKQKNTIGREAFKQELDKEGYYVRCRPESEAEEELGSRADFISTLEPLNSTDTQADACGINVGRGTPTWIIDGERYVGEQSIETLSEATGCALPEGYGGE